MKRPPKVKVNCFFTLQRERKKANAHENLFGERIFSLCFTRIDKNEVTSALVLSEVNRKFHGISSEYSRQLLDLCAFFSPGTNSFEFLPSESGMSVCCAKSDLSRKTGAWKLCYSG